MSWTYRVVHHTFTEPDGTPGEQFGIYEVYDDVDRTEEPAAVVAETANDLRWMLLEMLGALDKPTIEEAA